MLTVLAGSTVARSASTKPAAEEAAEAVVEVGTAAGAVDMATTKAVEAAGMVTIKVR